MKYNFIRPGLVLIIITSLVIISTMGFLNKPAKQPFIAAGNGFAVVELFTSEGCSSCPAADIEVEKIAALYPGNVYVLGFHVDYWDRLGWKDQFSDAAYSQRQRSYAERFKLDGVYTPQVIVNGKEQFVGSDDKHLKEAVDAGLNTTDNKAIEITALALPGNTVQVVYKLSAFVNETVNIALIQTAAQTSVKRGENEGRVLRHINIVRDFKTLANAKQTGTVNLRLPNGMIPKECKVIVYLQPPGTGEITTVAAASIK